MPVICAKCGEELLGAVNRCWRCGQYALSTPDAAAAPPVRRSPVQLEQQKPRIEKPELTKNDPVPATSHEDVTVTASTDSDEGVRFLEPKDGEEEAAAESLSGKSDEAPPGSTESRTPSSKNSSTRATNWQDWIAIGGVVLGLLAIAFGWLTPWMLVLAAAGLVCGVLGIASRRKMLAIVALLFCMLGMSVSSVRLAYDLFLYLGDQMVTPVEPLPEDDFFDPLDSMEPLE